MQLFTLSDVLTRLNRRLGLTDDEPITRLEKIDYINEGIHEAESAIHKLGCEDIYFLASQVLPLTEDEHSYALPTNIYGNKIRRIVYANGSIIYEIPRIRRRTGVPIEIQAAEITQFGSNQRYQYLVKNDSAAFGNEIKLYPTPAADDASSVTIWYIRSANSVDQDADIVDIPEFMTFVLQFAKVECLRKLFMGNVPESEVLELERQREDMITSLREMVPDEDNLIDQDIGFYAEFDRFHGGF